jgi:hypothetical protein
MDVLRGPMVLAIGRSYFIKMMAKLGLRKP